MPEEIFDVAVLWPDKHVIHGRAKIEGKLQDFSQEMTSPQRAQYEDLMMKHWAELDNLLRGMVHGHSDNS